MKNIKDEIIENNIIFYYGKNYNGKFNKIKKENENEYKLIILNYLDFYYNDYEEKIKNEIKETKFSIFFSEKKKMIIIREVEIISTKKILNLLQILKEKKIKIIMIGSGLCIKKLNDFEKNNIKIIKSENDINYELEKQNIYLKNNNIKSIKILNENNINLELYKNINIIFNKKQKINDIINIFNEQKILIPLIIHENYKEILGKKEKKIEKYNNLIYKISKYIKNFIIYENNILYNQKWYLNDLNCIYLCKTINNIYSKYKIYNNYKLNYTRILTKNSIKAKNTKNKIEIFKKIKIIHNFDNLLIEYINKILILYLINDKKKYYEEIKKYGFEKNDFLKIIKYTNEYYYIKNIKIIKKKL